MYELVQPSLWIHAPSLHPVQSRLSTVQDEDTRGQTEVFQIYIESSWSSRNLPRELFKGVEVTLLILTG